LIRSFVEMDYLDTDTQHLAKSPKIHSHSIHLSKNNDAEEKHQPTRPHFGSFLKCRGEGIFAQWQQPPFFAFFLAVLAVFLASSFFAGVAGLAAGVVVVVVEGTVVVTG